MLRPLMFGCCLIAVVSLVEKVYCQSPSNLELVQAQGSASPLPPQRSSSVYSITGNARQNRAAQARQFSAIPNGQPNAFQLDPNNNGVPLIVPLEPPVNNNRVDAAATGLRIVSRPSFGTAADNRRVVRKLLDYHDVAPVAGGAVKEVNLPDYIHAEIWDQNYYLKFTAQTRADMIFDDVRGMTGIYSVTNIPTNGLPKRVYTDMTANGETANSFTYFSFVGAKPTELGNSKLVVDSMVMASTSSLDSSTSEEPGQHSVISLRNLYGQLGGLAIGMAESAFADTFATPDLINNTQLFGVVNISVPSIRYIYSIDHDSNFTVSMEQPGTKVISTLAGTEISQVSHAPDLAVRYKLAREQVGSIQLAGVFRSLGAEELPSAANHDDAFGYGVHASGVLLLQHNYGEIPPDFLSASGVYGQGIGRYDSQIGLLPYADAIYYPTSGLDPLRLYSGMVGYTHFWTSTLRSTAAVAYGDLDTPSNVTDADGKSLFRRGYFASVNTFYVVNALATDSEKEIQSASADLKAAQVQIGLELIHGHQELSNKQDGESNRLQFTLQINK